MNSRKLAALRALSERPGTEAEGAVARDMLRRLEEKEKSHNRSIWDGLGDGPDDLIEAIRRYAAQHKDRTPEDYQWRCACGIIWPFGQKCKDAEAHAKIQHEIRLKFKRGDRVFYNYWAYPPNCAARVTGYCDGPVNGSYPWAWIGLKFDHLKSGYRKVPIYTTKGWHLSKDEKVPDLTDILRGP